MDIIFLNNTKCFWIKSFLFLIEMKVDLDGPMDDSKGKVITYRST